MDDDAILNRAQLDTMRELGELSGQELLTELANDFAIEVSRGTVAIAAAIKANDAKALELAAHTLRSVCGNLGADRMMRLCQQIEYFGKENRGPERSLAGARPMLDTLAQEHRNFVRAFEIYHAEGTSLAG